MSFRTKLDAAVRRNDSLLCIGLDPQPERLPIDDVLAFNRAIIEATADLVCAFKPQSAFYEAIGTTGWQVLRETIAAVPNDVPVILDGKRGDVAHTAEAYAVAAFDALGADAATVNPYLGADAVAPFLSRPDRAAFVICRTSNPGAPEIQDQQVNGAPLYLHVADRVRAWGEAHHDNAGLVVGATYPGELAAVRRRCPDLPILLPGIGAQGGDLEASVSAGLDSAGLGLLVSASRSVLYASAAEDFAQAARAEAARLRDAINVVREAARAGAP